jgi:hypothetical protein
VATGDRTITVVRRPRKDKLSTAASSEPTEFDIRDVAILPRQAVESDRGWINVEGYDIWVLATSTVADPDGDRGYADDDVLSSDFIRIDGTEWQVDGPDAYFTKKGSLAGAKIQVKRVGS